MQYTPSIPFMIRAVSEAGGPKFTATNHGVAMRLTSDNPEKPWLNYTAKGEAECRRYLQGIVYGLEHAALKAKQES